MSETNRNRGRLPGQSSQSSQVRELLAAGMSTTDIVKKVGCSRGLVYVLKSQIRAGGRGKKRGPGSPPKAPTSLPNPNSTSGKIRELLKTDMSISDIAEKLGCRVQLVYNVRAAQAAGSRVKEHGPARPPKAKAAPAGLDGLAGLLDAVKNGDRECAQLRGALERIRSVIADALA